MQEDASPKSTSSARVPVQLVPAAKHGGDHPTSPQKDDDLSRPTISDLAKKRAERFGIPVYTKESTEPAAAISVPAVDLKPAAVHAKADEEMNIGDSKEGEHHAEGESLSAQVVHHEYDDLLASGIPEGSIVSLEDFVIDNSNFKRIQKIIESGGGEAKVREVVGNVSSRINKEFDGDRSKIRAPPRLATSRLSFGLKQALPRLPRQEKPKPTVGGDKKKVVNLRGGNDWKHKDNRGRSHSYDSFESDVEEFIRRNRLDKRSTESMRTESKGMVSYVMDQGFSLDRYNNPSREVMIRMNEYRKSKRTGGGYGERSFNNGNRGSGYNSAARSPSRSYSRGRSRSRSRSYQRDRYDRDSRSRSM